MYTGEAINCWVCSSDTDQRCNDPMNMTKTAVEDCSRAPHSAFLQPVCKKQKQRGTSLVFARINVIIYDILQNVTYTH